ncbi:MAG: aldehyde dehydrogenase family protein [Candidatus Absconditicoccaceae bacterium]
MTKTIGEISEFPRHLDDIPEQFQPWDVEITEYLDGTLKKHEGGFQKVYSPIINKFVGTPAEPCYLGNYPLMTVAQAESVLQTAIKAWASGTGEWPRMSWQQRITHIEKFIEMMKSRRDAIVRILMWEIGKTSKDSFKEFDRTIEYIQKTIIEYRLLNEGTDDFRLTEGLLARVPRTPIGVTLCMGPFNYPLNETLTIIIPALIMGNVVIYKPAKYGVLLNAPLLECFAEAFPQGVVGTVFGDGQTVITPLMQSGKIDCFAFIGLSSTADKIVKNHPNPHRLRMILGLEAKNPAVIFANADIDSAVRECITGSLSFNGQRCTAIKIIFVQKLIADEFVKKFSEAVDALPLGMPWDDQSLEGSPMQTPMPEVGKIQWMGDYITDAIFKGAQTTNLRAGMPHHTMMIPAVLYPVNPSMKIYHEEQFGPVVPIVPYDDLAEVVQYMENSPYGQQISLFTPSKEIDKLITQLANMVCRININMQCQRGPDILPFTGRKNSAMGTLSIYDALRSFSIRTVIAKREE